MSGTQGPLRPPVTVSIVKDDLDKIIKSVRLITTQKVLVGIPSDKADRDPQQQTGPITNAALGYIHEHGAPEVNIPPRPFLVPGLRESQDKWLKPLQKAAEVSMSSAANPDQIDKYLHAAGLIAQNAVKMKIRSGPFVPLKAATIRARVRAHLSPKAAAKVLGNLQLGDIRPLIDTAQLLNSITYVIRKVSRTWFS